MYKEKFQDLVEILALEKEIMLREKNCLGHDDRVGRLNQQKKAKSERHAFLVNEMELAQSLIQKQEAQLQKEVQHKKRLEENLKEVSSQRQMDALEGEKKLLESKITALENEVFELMDKCEKAQKENEEISVFLQGLEKSLSIVAQEANQDKLRELSEKEGLEERKKTLLAGLPKEMSQAFYSLTREHRDSFLAFIDTGHCSQCHFAIPRNMASQIELCNDLEFCPSCRRLFIPAAVQF